MNAPPPQRAGSTSFTTWDGDGRMMRITMKSAVAWGILTANGPLAQWLRGERAPDVFCMRWLEANARSTRLVPNAAGDGTIQAVLL